MGRNVVKTEHTYQVIQKDMLLIGWFLPRTGSSWVSLLVNEDGHHCCWVWKARDGTYAQALWMDQSLRTHRVPGTVWGLQTWDKTQPPFSSSPQLLLHPWLHSDLLAQEDWGQLLRKEFHQSHITPSNAGERGIMYTLLVPSSPPHFSVVNPARRELLDWPNWPRNLLTLREK